MNSHPAGEHRAVAGQKAVTTALFAGYAAYYVCRVDLSVCAPLMLTDRGLAGLTPLAIGAIGSIGSLTYAFGKLATGPLADCVGGDGLFVAGMVGSAACTALFSHLSTPRAFATVWALNMLLQSLGWGALIRIVADRFPPGRYGRILGWLSASYLVGDGVTRLTLGALAGHDWGWRPLVDVSAAALFVVGLFAACSLRRNRLEHGRAQRRAATVSSSAQVPHVFARLLRSGPFRSTLMLSCGLTAVREALTLWTPAYFVREIGLQAGTAAWCSLVLPVWGGVSMVLVGGMSDRRWSGGRLMPPMFALLALTLGTLGIMPRAAVPAVGLIALAAFFLLGPYSLLEGVVVLDLAGPEGGATAAGIVGAAGYFGAIASGWGFGLVIQYYGWAAGFRALAALAAVCAAVALDYARRTPRSAALTASRAR